MVPVRSMVDRLGCIFQQVEQYLLKFIADTGHPCHLRIEVALDFDSAEVEVVRQSEVIAGNFQCLVDQLAQLALGQLAVAQAAEAEHVSDYPSGTRTGLMD